MDKSNATGEAEAAIKIQRELRKMKDRRRAEQQQANIVKMQEQEGIAMQEGTGQESIVEVRSRVREQALPRRASMEGSLRLIHEEAETDEVEHRATLQSSNESSSMSSPQLKNEDEAASTTSDPEQEAAAIKIQAGMRGMRDRKKVSMKRKETEPEENEAVTGAVPRVLSVDVAGGGSWSGPSEEEMAELVRAGRELLRQLPQAEAARLVSTLREATSPLAERLRGEMEGSGAAGREDKAGVGELEEAVKELLESGRELLSRLSEEQAEAVLEAIRRPQSPVAEHVRGLVGLNGTSGTGVEGIEPFHSRTPASDPEVEAAAIKIQAGMRGMRDRKEVSMKRQDMEPVENEALAGRLYSPRGGESEERREDETAWGEAGEAKVEDGEEGGEITDGEDREEAEAAAIKIQAGMRGMRDRKEVSMKRKDTEPVENVALAGLLYSPRADLQARVAPISENGQISFDAVQDSVSTCCSDVGGSCIETRSASFEDHLGRRRVLSVKSMSMLERSPSVGSVRKLKEDLFYPTSVSEVVKSFGGRMVKRAASSMGLARAPSAKEIMQYIEKNGVFNQRSVRSFRRVDSSNRGLQRANSSVELTRNYSSHQVVSGTRMKAKTTNTSNPSMADMVRMVGGREVRRAVAEMHLGREPTAQELWDFLQQRSANSDALAGEECRVESEQYAGTPGSKTRLVVTIATASPDPEAITGEELGSIDPRMTEAVPCDIHVSAETVPDQVGGAQSEHLETQLLQLRQWSAATVTDTLSGSSLDQATKDALLEEAELIVRWQQLLLVG